MGTVKKTGKVRKTSVLEMTADDAFAAMKKLRAILDGTSTDWRGAKAAQRDINRYIRLLNQQNAGARLELTAIGRIKKLEKRKGGAAEIAAPGRRIRPLSEKGTA